MQHVLTTQSDHCALLIRMQKSDWCGYSNGLKPFRFENAWTRHAGYEEAVQGSWVPNDSTLFGVHTTLGGVRQRLQNLSRDEFGSVHKQLKCIREQLEHLCFSSLRRGPCRVEHNLMRRISELVTREEIQIQQRARVHWLTEGDRNTAFFHAKVKQRHPTNKIKSLRREDGTVATS